MRKRYSSDLSNKQWKRIKHFFENENRGKHFREHKKRKLVNAVLYLRACLKSFQQDRQKREFDHTQCSFQIPLAVFPK